MSDFDVEESDRLGFEPVKTRAPGEPSYATKPTIGAKHDLFQIELIAKVLGIPLMPWQRYVSRVASERSLTDPRRFRYHTVILTVPRQSGKTTLMRAILTQRGLMSRARSAFYTAQTGKDATARWKDLIKQLEGSCLGQYTDTKLAQGSQSLTFSNGSSISPFAPTPKSLHGYTPHDVMLDEIFEWDSEQGEALLGAVKPAQITLLDRQLWEVSTMGTEDSHFLNDQIDKGRAAVNDPDSGIAYFEWSLEEGLDSYDPDNWDFHPALGYTITKQDLMEATVNHSVGEWERAYMNRRTKVKTKFIPDEILDLVMGEVSPPATPADVHIAYDVDPKQDGGASIMAAWKDAQSGKIHAKVYMLEPGRSWLTGAMQDAIAVRAGRYCYDNTAINRHYSGLINNELVQPTNTGDFTTACMMLPELIKNGQVVIAPEWQDREVVRNGVTVVEPEDIVKAAIQSVTTRPLGEGWAFSRKLSSGDISIAVGLALAVKSASHTVQGEAPQIRF